MHAVASRWVQFNQNNGRCNAFLPLWTFRAGVAQTSDASSAGFLADKKGDADRFRLLSDVFRGRPCLRKVYSRSKTLAVLFCQAWEPNGWPRASDRRNASSSASVSTRLTRFSQSAG